MVLGCKNCWSIEPLIPLLVLRSMYDVRYNRMRWGRSLWACWQAMLRWHRHETLIFCFYAQKLMLSVQEILVYISWISWNLSSGKCTWWGAGDISGITCGTVNIKSSAVMCCNAHLCTEITLPIIFLLLYLMILEIERGSTRLHPMENSFWKRLWTCHKTDYRMTEWYFCLLVK
jgi:hypothetical protein